MAIFLWPAPRFRPASLLSTWKARSGDVEGALRAVFPQGEPVFVSSARAGIALTIGALDITRPDLVSLPPYSSHCLIEAVARVGTPVGFGATAKSTASIIYHQWGHVQTRSRCDAVLIEDACDSLCRPGSSPLFPMGGRFEIWSLPKIFGCSSGGVVWCRSTHDAYAVRTARDNRRDTAFVQWLLRRLGAYFQAPGEYWAGKEAGAGPASSISCAEALQSIEHWNEAVVRREKCIELVKTIWPSWLSRNPGRLPCAVPVRDSTGLRAALHALSVDVSPRHFERVHKDGSVQLIKVLPLPIHQDIDIRVLEQVAMDIALEPALE